MLCLGIVVMVAVIIAMSGGLLWIDPHVIFAAKRQKLLNEMNQVQTAILNFYIEYNEYPDASSNAVLIQTLDASSAKQNLRRIHFATFQSSDLDAQHELLDPWGTPIQFSVSADGTVHARSAGPDKTFGTADDIKGDFTPPGFK